MEFDSNYLLIAGVLVVVFGVFYSLGKTASVYGGIIGSAIRLFGFGTAFVVLGVMVRILVDLTIIEPSTTVVLTQHIFDLIGLGSLGLGFSKLASGTKV